MSANRLGAPSERLLPTFETVGFESVHTVEIGSGASSDGECDCPVVRFDRTGAHSHKHGEPERMTERRRRVRCHSVALGTRTKS